MNCQDTCFIYKKSLMAAHESGSCMQGMHLCACVHVCVCVYVVCVVLWIEYIRVHLYMEASLPESLLQTYFLKQCISLNLELTH